MKYRRPLRDRAGRDGLNWRRSRYLASGSLESQPTYLCPRLPIYSLDALRSASNLVRGWGKERTITTTRRTSFSLMYLASASTVRASSTDGGVVSSIKVEDSLPILRGKRPDRGLVFWCRGRRRRPMVAVLERGGRERKRQERISLRIRYKFNQG